MEPIAKREPEPSGEVAIREARVRRVVESMLEPDAETAAETRQMVRDRARCEAVVVLRAAGWCQSHIADAIGWSDARIRDTLRAAREAKAGRADLRCQRSVTPAQETRISDLRAGGASWSEVAESVGCTVNIARYVMDAVRGRG